MILTRLHWLKVTIVQLLSHRLRRKGRRRVLISYIVRPFLGINHHHPNDHDVRCIYEIFDEAGWDITVVDYRRIAVAGSFDLVIGFGHPLAWCLRKRSTVSAIYYATGAPFYVQSAGSVRALTRYIKAVGKPKPRECMSYMRYTNMSQPLQMVLCDGIFCLGGEPNISEYRQFAPTVPLAPIVLPEGKDVLMTRKRAAHGGFLWFGGNGPIHKGLDLCISVLAETGDYLAIAGTAESKKVLKEFSPKGNIRHHGFLTRGSEAARAVMQECRFVILPSASEANPTSVVAAVLDGNLLPIVSRECAMSDERDLIVIESLTAEGVHAAISQAKALSPEEIVSRVQRVRQRFLRLYSRDQVKEELKKHLEDYLN